jgi:hypothetical protein
MPFYVIGVDLGQVRDCTALAVVRVIGTTQTAELPATRYSTLAGREMRTIRQESWEGLPARYEVEHLERLPLGTRYPEVVARVAECWGQVPDPKHLVVDATGVGGPVVDLLRERGLPAVAVTITAGDAPHVDAGAGALRVPKRDLVAAVEVSLQDGRLKIAEALPEAQTLLRELLAFGENGARSGEHDDLVLALALACWVGWAALGQERTFTVYRPAPLVGGY